MTCDDTAISNHLKALVDSKNFLERVLPIYDELSDSISTFKKLEILECLFILMPVLIVSILSNIPMLGVFVNIAVHLTFLRLADRYVFGSPSYDVPRELRRRGAFAYASACTNKKTEFESELPFLKFFVSAHKMHHYILTQELNKTFEDLTKKHIVQVRESLSSGAEQETLDQLLSRQAYNEDDANFLRSAILYDCTLSELFQVS